MILFVLFAIISMGYGQEMKALDKATISSYSKIFNADKSNVARQNALANNSIKSLSVDKATRTRQQHLFSDKIDVKGISNQKSSGRCWLFAGLNILRPVVIEKYDLEKADLKKLNPLYWKREQGKIVEGRGPTL